MKVLCNAKDCRFNIEDKDENNSYHRKCSLEEVEIYEETTHGEEYLPICFTYEGK